MTVKSDCFEKIVINITIQIEPNFMAMDKEFLHKQLFFFRLRRACREGGNASKVLLFQCNKT